MKKFFIVFVALCASAMAAEFKGTISDAKCGKAHADASEKAQKCVNACIKNGQAPVFVQEDGTVLKIHNADSVKDHYGHKVTITGNVTDGSIHIDSVKM